MNIFTCSWKKSPVTKMRLVWHIRRRTRHRDPAMLNTSSPQILFTSLK